MSQRIAPIQYDMKMKERCDFEMVTVNCEFQLVVMMFPPLLGRGRYGGKSKIRREIHNPPSPTPFTMAASKAPNEYDHLPVLPRQQKYTHSQIITFTSCGYRRLPPSK
jgi:hypothetical protein